MTPDELAYDERGLIPAVVQEAETGEVLMVAWMDRDAVGKTLTTGLTHFWSRSRRAPWQKGETSGHVQHVQGVYADCDADTLVVQVHQEGVACHTGARTCFFTGDMDPTPHEVLPALERTLQQRQAERPQGSYTVELLDDPALIGAKVQEEAEEVARAAREESDERVAEEAADVLYHLTVLLASRDLSLADAYEVLNARRH